MYIAELLRIVNSSAEVSTRMVMVFILIASALEVNENKSILSYFQLFLFEICNNMKRGNNHSESEIYRGGYLH